MNPLSLRMREAADTIAELNARYGFGDHLPWEPSELCRQSRIVHEEEQKGQS